jgi:hypothetical protein
MPWQVPIYDPPNLPSPTAATSRIDGLSTGTPIGTGTPMAYFTSVAGLVTNIDSAANGRPDADLEQGVNDFGSSIGTLFTQIRSLQSELFGKIWQVIAFIIFVLLYSLAWRGLLWAAHAVRFIFGFVKFIIKIFVGLFATLAITAMLLAPAPVQAQGTATPTPRTPTATATSPYAGQRLTPTPIQGPTLVPAVMLTDNNYWQMADSIIGSYNQLNRDGLIDAFSWIIVAIFTVSALIFIASVTVADGDN